MSPGFPCWSWRARRGDRDEDVGAMDGESFPTDPAGAEDQGPVTRLSM